MANNFTTQLIPTADAIPNPRQPRKVFNRAELEELANSIRQNGLAQPITVVPSEGLLDCSEPWMILMGERRWRAHQLAGIAMIPATIRTDLSPLQIKKLALVENINRADMNAMEESNAFQDLVDDEGLKPKQIAESIGKDEDYVKDRLALQKLGAEFQDALMKGVISFQQARQLAYVSIDGQARAFRAITSGKADTVAKLKRIVVAIYDAENQQNLFKMPDELTPAQRNSLAAVDRFIEGADRIVSLLTDDDLQIVRMTLKSDAPRCIEKLKLLTATCGRLQLALETAVAKFDEAQQRRTAA